MNVWQRLLQDQYLVWNMRCHSGIPIAAQADFMTTHHS